MVSVAFDFEPLVSDDGAGEAVEFITAEDVEGIRGNLSWASRHSGWTSDKSHLGGYREALLVWFPSLVLIPLFSRIRPQGEIVHTRLQKGTKVCCCACFEYTSWSSCWLLKEDLELLFWVIKDFTR